MGRDRDSRRGQDSRARGEQGGVADGDPFGGRCVPGGELMLSLPANVPLYLYTTPTDMRKSFDGLHTLVRQVFELDPLDGHLFLFVNRRRDRIKLL